MTFSGDFNVSEVIKKVRKMLYKLGLELNNDKIHVIIHSSSRQNITGIVVNNKLQVSKSYRNKIRQEMYYIKKYGFESHIDKSSIKASKGKYFKQLYGIILFVLQVNDTDRI